MLHPVDLTKKLSRCFGRKSWLIFPLLVFSLTVAFHMRGTYEPLNNWLLDQRMDRTPVASTEQVGVIAIDPQSLKDIGTWPWSRSVHADILDRLVELGAGVVVFDVDFAFPSDEVGDQAFADALDRAGGATLLPTFFQRGLDGNIVVNRPHDPFRDRSWPALVTVAPNEIGQIRTYPTGASVEGQFVPSAGVQLAGSYSNETLDYIVNFGISPNSIPVFSATDLLNGNVAREEISGRSFLIGAAAAELGDHFAVPLHQVVPGVMIHAIAAETLLQNAEIRLVPAYLLLVPLFILILGLHFVGRQKAWRLVSLAFLASVGVEYSAGLVFATSYSSLPTAMFHPALILLAIGRLAKSVDLSRILIKRQEVQMVNDERLREHIFENSSDGFLAVSESGNIVFQSDVAKSLLGSGQLHPKVMATSRRVISEAHDEPQLEHLEFSGPHGTKSLELHANRSELRKLDNGNNLASEPLALITLRDVTDLKRKERQIEYLSRHDDKTIALRRHSFSEVIEKRLEAGNEFAVAAISLGRLTAINATLGRDVGDQTIAEAVNRLTDQALDLGEVARLEGNVLGVIIPKSGADLLIQDECRRIREALTKPYHLGDSQIQIEVSVGYVSTKSEMGWDGEDCLARAQDALASSEEKKSSVSVPYDNSVGERRKRSRLLEHALNQALKRKEFYVLYQPQYRLSDRSLMGAEALIRWESAEFGNVSPAEFIPIAESSGFIAELGQFVLESTIEAAKDLPQNLIMSPNVSTFQLLSDDFPGQVSSLLSRHDLPSKRLCLELTESEYLSPDSDAVQSIHDLKALGVSWALDDFGTGYSSLSYLKDLPFDKIKLDRAFLKDILTDSQAQITLQSLVQMVHGFGKTLLCEGAETEEEVALLTEMGCDSVQGYFFGRPETLSELQKRADDQGRETSLELAEKPVF